MQTVKFRKSRVVILVVFLICVSSLGYWLMYVTSRPHSRLTEMHSHVDRHHILRHSHTDKFRSGSRLSDHQAHHSDILQDRDRDRVHFDEHKDRDHSQHKEAIHADRVQEKGELHVAGLAKDDKYDDYSDDEGMIDDKPAVKHVPAAAAQHHDAGRTGKHDDIDSPAAADNYDYPYDDDDDKNVRKKGYAQRPIEDNEKDIGHDSDTVNQRPSLADRRKENFGNVDDDSVRFDRKKQHGDGSVIDKGASAAESRWKEGGGAKQKVSWRDRTEMAEVDLDGMYVRKLKTDKPKVNEQKDKAKINEQKEEEWRLQQVNDGVRASHVRSHNVAPVPRVYGSSLLDHIDGQDLQKVTRRTSDLDDVVENINTELPRRSAAQGSMSSKYFIIHSGRASQVNAALHPNLYALPEHVAPETYIFTSARSVLKNLLLLFHIYV